MAHRKLKSIHSSLSSQATPALKAVQEHGNGTCDQRFYLIGITILIIGLVCRIWLAQTAIQWGYVPDHFDNIGTGVTAEQNGLLKIYSVEREQLADIHGFIFQQGEFVAYHRKAATLPNYPPLYVIIRWMQVKLLRVFEPTIVANTLSARLVMGSASFLAELITAWGAFLIARKLFNLRAGYLAGILVWLFPPVMMNSAFWEQVDAFVLAPTIFLVWFMLERRWIAAGVVFGIGAMLKPQGLILGPVVLFGIAALMESDAKLTIKIMAKRAIQVFGAAILTILIVSLPWMVADGLSWVKRSYIHSFLEAFPRTTLSAFNVWYIDALRLDSQLSTSVLDSQAVILGLSKDAWGRAFLIGSLAVIGHFCWRKYRRVEMGLVVFAGLWLWSTFIWPTRVHERYFIYCVPLLVILACGRRLLWPAVIGLLIVGTAETSHNVWLKTPAGSLSKNVVERYHQQTLENYRQSVVSRSTDQYPPAPTYEDVLNQIGKSYWTYRANFIGKELLLTVLSLAAYGWAMITLLLTIPQTATRETKT